MKYSLIIQLLLYQLVTFGQESSCLLSATSVFKNGKLTYELKNAYNDKQQLLTKEERFLGNEMLNYTTSHRFIYDEKGNIIETTNYLNGKFNRSVYQKYDEQNQLIEEAIVTADEGKKQLTKIANGDELRLLNEDGMFSKVISEKDGIGNVTKKTTHGLDGKATTTTTYTYNQRGELIEQSETDLFRGRTSATVFERDKAGEVQKEVTTINGELFRRIINSFNEAGNKIESRTYNRSDQLDYVLKYTYDDRKNITTESYFYNEEQITKTENTYDVSGNLTLQRNFNRGKLVSTTTNEYICF